jgi:hypothetical protein
MMQYRICVKEHVYKVTVDPWYGTFRSVDVNYARLNAMQKWCKENVAQDDWNYYGMYKDIPFEFKFRNGEDFLAFKFRFEFL